MFHYRHGEVPVRIRCSTTQENYYHFISEEIFLFSMAKASTSYDNDKLCTVRTFLVGPHDDGPHFLYHVYDRKVFYVYVTNFPSSLVSRTEIQPENILN